jgi:hypothetical protein
VSAISAVEKALQLAKGAGMTETAAIFQKLLELYKSGTPYRD